jgi:hypothetical protein
MTDWSQVENDVARAVRALAERAAEAVPDVGGFEFVDQRFEVNHADWNSGAVTLRIGPVPQAPPATGPTDRRYVQVRVATPSGGSESSRWLTAGSKAEAIAFLASSDTAERVLETIRQLAESQRQQGLP